MTTTVEPVDLLDRLRLSDGDWILLNLAVALGGLDIDELMSECAELAA